MQSLPSRHYGPARRAPGLSGQNENGRMASISDSSCRWPKATITNAKREMIKTHGACLNGDTDASECSVNSGPSPEPVSDLTIVTTTRGTCA